MGVNMAGFAIVDDEICRDASRQEIIRRYYDARSRRSAREILTEAMLRRLSF